MAFVGEALLSALIDTLVDKLAASDLLRFARQEQVLADLKKWENMLKKIGAVLDDADDKQLTSAPVKMWLDDLRDLAYDVEDILDDFATEALERKLMAGETLPNTSKVRRFIPSCCSRFTPSALTFNAKMRSKLDDITTRLQDISSQKMDLGLTNNITGGRPNTAREKLSTTGLVDESRVLGRETDKAAIVDLLLQAYEPGGNAVEVIPIIGMGGLGKTTLAQLAFNDDKVKNSFDLRVWVCVSDEFDVVRVTETILLKVASIKPAANDLDELQVKLKGELSRKKFLLVLDDVWNEKGEKWDSFYKPIRTGEPGSKVIVTTRNEGVVSTMGGRSPYVLKELSNDECLSLFAQQALGTRNFDAHPHLKHVGHLIANKCKGLPLAAKTLGGILRTKLTRDAWEDVLESKIWDLPEDKNDILPALKLSYHYLPSHLKRCFSYCSLFPKDFEFDMNELVLLWMGEGLIHQVKRNKQMEEIGIEYFNELLARSFFQRSNSNSSRFVMHDLVSDLAQFVAGDVCFILEQNNETIQQQTISERVRHSSFIRERYEISRKFEALHNWKNLRTLLSLCTNNQTLYYANHISVEVLHDLLKGMRFLRVLSLTNYRISEVPDFIGELKHLRHLNFSHCSIKRLPDSICCLYNLQSLVLASCSELVELPGGIGNLVNLRHLDITDTLQLREIPFQICNLTNLQKLSRFIVSRSRRLGIEGMKDLSNLNGELSISGLHEIENIKDAREANLKDKQKIKVLSMEWSDDMWGSRNEEDESLVLESLQPHESLERLSIKFYGGSKFPNWTGDPTFSKLSSLTLENCKRCSSLPSLGGLPSLERLRIAGMIHVKVIGGEFYGECWNPFASLKELKIENMPEWESWYHSNLMKGDGRLFPSLEELRISGCPKLVGELPKDPRSLLELDVSECPKLNRGGSMVALQELRISDYDGLTCLFGEEEELPCNLKILSIDKCASLERLSNELHRLARLEELRIERCPKLESFPDTGGLPPVLRELWVNDCQGLKLMPQNYGSSSSALESLEIHKCPSLRGFPSGELPTTLKTLRISDCENLESLPEGLMQQYPNSTCNLEVLSIQNCRSLKYFPRLKLPSTLKHLEINACSNLESISENMWPDNPNLQFLELRTCPNLKTLPAECFHGLESLDLRGCEALECFPAGGLFTRTLKSLWVWDCKNLKSLPHQMRNLQSLQRLWVDVCPGVESFPDGGLAPNLTTLYIGECVNLKTPISEWGLQAMTSLSVLTISNTLQNLVSISDEEHSPLPPSLTSLSIGRMESLASLPLHNLTSLQELWIWECPKLRSFGRLPPTFRWLEIRECPGIKERCKKKKGDYWPNIAHIPCIVLDGECMH